MTAPLPTHPFTGLKAIGFRRDGAPIWPVLGGAPDPEPALDPTDQPPADPPADPKPADADPLGDAGKKALAAEREARKAAEKKLAAYEKAEQAKADADKTEAEKRAAAEQRAQDAELRAMRIEVAHEKGLTPAQAKRLVGGTREELEADAEQLLKDFPVAPAKPATPKPDPSQGARGEPAARPTSLGAAIANAYKAK